MLRVEAYLPRRTNPIQNDVAKNTTFLLFDQQLEEAVASHPLNLRSQEEFREHMFITLILILQKYS